MGLFRGKLAFAGGNDALPDVSAVQRQYRPALTGAAQALLGVLEQSRLQGRPVDQQPLASRARTADQFWHFLERELNQRRLGSVGSFRVDPQLNAAAQTVHDWAARRCGIRPEAVACFAWADVLNQAAQKQYAADNPGEPSWKGRLSAPAHFAAVAENATGQPVDGVAQVEEGRLRFLLPGEDRETEFGAGDVRGAHAEPDGYRLEVGAPFPYASLLLLAAADGGAALEGALQRAGVLGA